MSSVSPTNNGANTDATGIRQFVTEAIPRPARTVPMTGRPPKKALPASTLLQETRCEIRLAQDTKTNAKRGRAIQSTVKKFGSESRYLKDHTVIIRKKMEKGPANTMEFILEPLLSGSVITIVAYEIYGWPNYVG
jgi:hypothetical protein